MDIYSQAIPCHKTDAMRLLAMCQKIKVAWRELCEIWEYASPRIYLRRTYFLIPFLPN